MIPNEIQILNPIFDEKNNILELHLDHGRVNEMGSQQLRAWEHLTHYLESGQVRALITTSQKKSRSGKSIFSRYGIIKKGLCFLTRL